MMKTVLSLIQTSKCAVLFKCCLKYLKKLAVHMELCIIFESKNCNFQNVAPPFNEFTRDAAVALAKAAEANANAISEIAKCLEGAVFEGPMIQIGQQN